MRQPRVSVAVALFVRAGLVAAGFVLVGCTGQRPSLDADPPIMVPGSASAGKIVSLDPRAVDLSVVATAVVANVGVYDAPDAANPIRTLTNPLASGASLNFLVDRTVGEWYQVLLPTAPAGATGWIRAADVAIAQHNYRIEIHPDDFRLELYLRGELVRQIAIGVAVDNVPARGARYFTTELLQATVGGSSYGSFAYGLSGFSDTLTSFDGLGGQLGIHGTDEVTTIGQPAMTGCIRMSNADIESLARMLPLGVPVQISD